MIHLFVNLLKTNDDDNVVVMVKVSFRAVPI